MSQDYTSVGVHECEFEALRTAVQYSDEVDSKTGFLRHMILAYHEHNDGDVLPDELRERIEDRQG